MSSSLGQHYFDELYRHNADPWSFETSDYERGKYERTLEALPRRRYANAFEIGCSIGVLTEKLTARCEQLLSTDVAAAPLEKARARCADLPQVTFRQAALPQDFPTDRAPFDLIVASEVLYFLVGGDFTRALDLIIEHLTPNGQLLLVHWTPFVAEFPQTGDAVHDAVLARAGEGQPLRHLHGERAETYRLDLFERASD